MRTPALIAAEKALATALADYLELAEEFSANPLLCDRVRDLIPPAVPAAKGSYSVLQFFGIPVRSNPDVPPGEIRVYSKGGDVVAAVKVRI